MVSGSQFGNHAAKFRVNPDLTEYPVPDQAVNGIENGDGGLVAARLNTQYGALHLYRSDARITD
jgi:hypothetical protein